MAFSIHPSVGKERLISVGRSASRAVAWVVTALQVAWLLEADIPSPEGPSTNALRTLDFYVGADFYSDYYCCCDDDYDCNYCLSYTIMIMIMMVVIVILSFHKS